MTRDKIIAFIRTNWLSLVLISIIVYLLTRPTSPIPLTKTAGNLGRGEVAVSYQSAPGMDMVAEDSILPPDAEPAPTDSQDRLTIVESALALLVDSVANTVSSIQAIAESHGGYLVSSNVNQPEGGATGSITIRVPVSTRDQALDEIRSLGIRVVSESTSGHDVTDSYIDIAAHLTTLNSTKAKFEAMLANADTVQDTLAVQRELTALQRQIDSYVGRQKYLEGSAELSKITVSLATDELSLPYAPDEPWRPAAIFKTAVRSLVQSGRGLVSALIWIIVYSPLWLLALGVFWYLGRRRG